MQFNLFDDDVDIPAFFKREREIRNLTIQQLANITGLSVATIKKIETDGIVNKGSFNSICEAYHYVKAFRVDLYKKIRKRRSQALKDESVKRMKNLKLSLAAEFAKLNFSITQADYLSDVALKVFQEHTKPEPKRTTKTKK